MGRGLSQCMGLPKAHGGGWPPFETRKHPLAKVWKLASDNDNDSAETRLCVWSDGRQAKEDSMLAQRRERFEQELRQLHAGLSKAGCTKRYARVLERLGRIKERHKAVAGQYHITVTQKAPETTAADAAKPQPAAPNQAGAGRRRRVAAQRQTRPALGHGGDLSVAHQSLRLGPGARGAHVLAAQRH